MNANVVELPDSGTEVTARNENLPPPPVSTPVLTMPGLAAPSVSPSLPTPCAEQLTQINESLARREALLAASAKASRLLLEAPDVRAVVPDVLRLIGEPAGVDRVCLMLSQAGPGGEPLLVVGSEWVAEGVARYLEEPSRCSCDERDF